jgi:predicted nucleotidyltransferase
MGPRQLEVADDKQDVKFYSLDKFIRLASECNPSVVELLFMPEECIITCTPVMQKLIEQRRLFVSMKAKHTFSGYAFAQIKKARGQNKWVNNRQPEAKPTKEDFCYLINVLSIGEQKNLFELGNLDETLAGMPGRPILYKEAMERYQALPLEKCRVAAVEHVHNLYRLYSDGRGVFRDGQLVCDSIPVDEEWGYFNGLLIYNEEAYNAAMRDHKNYWEWVKNRNDARWVTQERGEVDYDCKNLMHTMRLLFSGINILRKGEPIVRFTGEMRDYLMNVRLGKFTYEDLMKRTEELMAEIEVAYEERNIPYEADIDKIDELYLSLIGG